MTILDYLKQNIQKISELSHIIMVDRFTRRSFVFYVKNDDNDDGYFDFLKLILEEIELVDVCNENDYIVSDISSFIFYNSKFLENFILKYLVAESDNFDLFSFSLQMLRQAFEHKAFTKKFYLKFSEDFLKYKEEHKQKKESSLLLSAVEAIGSLLNEDVDSQENARECAGKIAEYFFSKGKDELGEYCLAQCNMCPTFTTF